ncbi:hypothetical protein MSG28_008228 [Choristoneura fumiferana]|uniref:Uncharacterized protein n=1 Tax=Choristoneura fumiferana TaxID=7141 RepID=A0ACC0JAU1_CHOFU|nr:hypothetical protein MSG28_008228 [Choristoneura fumiferana]
MLLTVEELRPVPVETILAGLPGYSILVPSGKGKHPLLLYKNQTYTYKVLSANGVLWHCSRRTRTGCKAFIKSSPDRLNVLQAVFDEHSLTIDSRVHGPVARAACNDGLTVPPEDQRQLLSRHYAELSSGKGKYPFLKYKNFTCTHKVHSSKSAFIKTLPDQLDVIQTVHDKHSHHPKAVLVSSGKGKYPLLKYKNFTYTHKVKSSRSVLWHCSRRTTTGCKAFIRTFPDQLDVIQTVYDEHSHHLKKKSLRCFQTRRP